MMRMMRLVPVALLAVAFSAMATADFDGPAPLAWRWIQPTPISPVGTPTVLDNTVYVAVGTRMYGLDKETGNQRWKFPLVDPIDGSFKSSVMLADGVAIAAADNKTIYAVDAKTGESKWSYIASAPIYREPVLAGKFVVFGLSDNTIMAINASDGQPAWKTPIKAFDGFMGKFGSYQSDFVFFTNNYQMVSYNAANPAKPNWTQRFNVLSPDVQAINLGDSFYVNTGSFTVGVAASNGRKVFEANSNDTLAFAPAANGTSVLSVSQDGKVYLFGQNGRPLVRKEIDLASQPSTVPSVIGNFYAVPTRNGAINLIDSKTGDVSWSYLVRPIGDQTIAPSNAGGRGGGRGGGLGGGLGGGQTANQPIRVLAIPAAGPAILSGDTLMLLASDGSLLAFDKKLGVDLTPPSVKMTWPNAGDIVSGQPPLELIFKIEDEASGINTKTLKIDVDGQPMDYEFGRDGIARIRISSLGKNKPLVDGRKTITVTVSDWMGNEAQTKFQLVIDNTLKPLTPPANNQGGPGGGLGGGGGKGGGGGGIG
jgi:outer membrane protein assembly factor BamB